MLPFFMAVLLGALGSAETDGEIGGCVIRVQEDPCKALFRHEPASVGRNGRVMNGGLAGMTTLPKEARLPYRNWSI